MKTCKVRLKSISPYSQGRFHDTPKLDKESHADYERRTWKNKLHFNKDGIIFIPPMAFKNSLSEIAKYLSMSIPGKGKQKYTKHFEAGVMVVKPASINIHIDDVEEERLHVPSDGRRGGTTRVMKSFPLIKEWEADVEYVIFDDTITDDVFEAHLRESGRFIGIGRFRPRNNGYYGRFEPVGDIVFEESVD